MDYEDFIRELQGELTVLKDLGDYESVRDRLSVRLLNTELQYDKLDSLFWRPYLDLSVTFAVVLRETEQYRGIVRVTEKLAQEWGVGFEIMLQDALENEKRDGSFKMEDMSILLNRMSEEAKIPDEMMVDIKDGAGWMYTIYDRSMTNGSAAMLMTDLLDDYSKQLNEDMIILPSSINELICLPYDRDRDISYLKSVVREVNDNVVHHDDILSYSVYRYSRDDNRVDIIA